MKQNLTWWQVNNLVPIISSAVLIALSFSALMTRVAVLENKVDSVLVSQEKMFDKYSGVEQKYGDFN